VVPPFVIYRTGRMDDARFAQTREALGQRLDTLFTAAPIPFRQQNAGAYEIPALTLRADIAPDASGFAAHVA
jgi:NAD(P)H dehydrogenase (quinone)